MRKLLIAAALVSGTTAAYAQLPDAYVGAGVLQARLDNIFGSGRDFDLNNTAWKAFVGVETNYMDLGSESRRFGFAGIDQAHALTPSPPLQSASCPCLCRS